MAASVQMSQQNTALPNLADIVKGVKHSPAPLPEKAEITKVEAPKAEASKAEAPLEKKDTSTDSTVKKDDGDGSGDKEKKPDGPKIFDNKKFVEAPIPKTNPWKKKQVPAQGPAPALPKVAAPAPAPAAPVKKPVEVPVIKPGRVF